MPASQLLSSLFWDDLIALPVELRADGEGRYGCQVFWGVRTPTVTSALEAVLPSVTLSSRSWELIELMADGPAHGVRVGDRSLETTVGPEVMSPLIVSVQVLDSGPVPPRAVAVKETGPQ